MKIIRRAARLKDLQRIEDFDIRAEDARELETARQGSSWQRALRSCLLHSTKAYVLEDEAGHLWGYLGFVKTDERNGVYPWMVGAEGSTRFRREWIRIGREFLEECHREAQYLVVSVDTRNHKHVRYLKFLGFVELFTHQVQGVPFNLMRKGK